MGYQFVVYDPSPGCTAGKVADKHICATYDNEEALKQFSDLVDVVTLEFENVPFAALDFLESKTVVHPSREVLRICRNRIEEKQFLATHNFKCGPNHPVHSAKELLDVFAKMQNPCVIKTAELGYDGKGQIKVDNPAESDPLKLWEEVKAPAAIVEEWLELESECSVICARNKLGAIKTFPVALNYHENHILQTSRVPSGLSQELEEQAIAVAKDIATKLKVVGLLAVEFFITKQGELLVNELAPRPHNSGHYTMDACVTSQFEQHIRAVCGLPLGSTELLSPVVMSNLLGDLWKNAEPDWVGVLRDPNIKLHLYDKGEPRAGRKMGHLNILSKDIKVAEIKDELLFEITDILKHELS